MKFIASIFLSMLLVACNSDLPGIGSSEPEGKFVSQDGKNTLIFEAGGIVRMEDRLIGAKEGKFVMEHGVANVEFPGGIPVSLKKVSSDTWEVEKLGTKYVQQ